MKAVVIVHKLALQRDKIAEILKYNNIIVFEVDNNIDLHKILEVMIPNLLIRIVNSKLNKATIYETYNNILELPSLFKVPMLFYNNSDCECFVCWRRAKLMEQETHMYKNCQSQQILETVHKILKIQHRVDTST
jgi:hypothetical protein